MEGSRRKWRWWTRNLAPRPTTTAVLNAIFTSPQLQKCYINSLWLREYTADIKDPKVQCIYRALCLFTVRYPKIRHQNPKSQVSRHWTRTSHVSSSDRNTRRAGRVQPIPHLSPQSCQTALLQNSTTDRVCAGGTSPNILDLLGTLWRSEAERC